MTFYRDQLLPHLIDLAMRNRELVAYRRRLIAQAEGRVLEIGIGSGLNLPFYGSHVQEVLGLEPAPKLLAMCRRASVQLPLPVTLIQGSAEDIPLDSESVDTVVTAWTLCSIPSVTRALSEARRVLRPSGRMLFVEHGLSPDAAVRRWQDRLTPIWKRISGGCHLNRAIDTLIGSAGFQIERLETGYMKGPKPMTFLYEGSARPR